MLVTKVFKRESDSCAKLLSKELGLTPATLAGQKVFLVPGRSSLSPTTGKEAQDKPQVLAIPSASYCKMNPVLVRTRTTRYTTLGNLWRGKEGFRFPSPMAYGEPTATGGCRNFLFTSKPHPTQTYQTYENEYDECIFYLVFAHTVRKTQIISLLVEKSDGNPCRANFISQICFWEFKVEQKVNNQCHHCWFCSLCFFYVWKLVIFKQ